MTDGPGPALPTPPSRWRGERGQAAVELALVLPFVVVLALVVLQVGLVVRDQVLVAHAAREGARQAAVDGDPGAVRKAVLAGSRLDPSAVRVEVGARGGPGSRVTVVIRYAAPTDVPIVGALVGAVALTDRATMRVER